jgi:CDP-glucose 4,6-dehydratase
MVKKMSFKTANSKFWKNKKIFLTGHTSFKGTWLKLWLEGLGAKIIGFSDGYPSYPKSLYKICYKKKIKKENILNYNYLKKKIIQSKPDIVFHFAAQSILSEAKKKPIDNFKTNIIGTASVLEACAFSRSTKLVAIITTDKCYEENNKIKFYDENSILGGSEPYSSSKACAEIISKSYQNKYKNLNKKIITLRAGNVIGGGDWKKDRLVPDIIKSLKSNSNLVLRNPNSIRPWQHVLDCLNGYLIAAEYSYRSKKTFNTWNFSPPLKNQIKVINFVKQIISSSNYPMKIITKSNKHFYESKRLNLSSKKAKSDIKWKTILNQQNVIKFIINWYKAYNNKENMINYSKNQILEFYKISKMKKI